MPPERIDIADVPRLFRRGQIVYLQGATGETKALRAALAADPERLAGVTLTGALLPGMNDFDYAALHPQARMELFLAAPHLRDTIADGRTRLLPLSYSQIAARFQASQPDLAILMVTPPERGYVTFGSCADFGPIIARRARRLIGVVNTALPRPLVSPSLPVEAFDALCEVHEPPSAVEAAIGADLAAICRRVAELVVDGATVETGIGAAPAAVWAALADHRGLVLASGMVTDGVLAALDAGALAPSGHVAGVAFGSGALAARFEGSDLIAFADVTETHDVVRLGTRPCFTAINSALEIDLYGQANLEWLDDRPISGVGGAPDFGRAAQLSCGGRSILALPSTAKGGTLSRICPRLTNPASLSRTEVDTVVTEHGVACLRGRTADERAEALIAIAAPEHRWELAERWRTQDFTRSTATKIT